MPQEKTAGEFGITGRGILDDSKAVILKDGNVAVDTPTGWSFFTKEGKRIPLGRVGSERIDEATGLFTKIWEVEHPEAVTPPAEVAPSPTEAKQEKFVNEYLASKGKKLLPQAEAPTISAQFPSDMPASQQVANRISFEPDKVSLREKFLRGKNKAMSQWIDKLYPIDTFVSEAKKLGAEISIEENPYLQARLLEGVTSKATTF